MKGNSSEEKEIVFVAKIFWAKSDASCIKCPLEQFFVVGNRDLVKRLKNKIITFSRTTIVCNIFWSCPSSFDPEEEFWEWFC